jgi:hypothetical protein
MATLLLTIDDRLLARISSAAVRAGVTLDTWIASVIESDFRRKTEEADRRFEESYRREPEDWDDRAEWELIWQSSRQARAVEPTNPTESDQ